MLADTNFYKWKLVELNRTVSDTNFNTTFETSGRTSFAVKTKVLAEIEKLRGFSQICIWNNVLDTSCYPSKTSSNVFCHLSHTPSEDRLLLAVPYWQTPYAVSSSLFLLSDDSIVFFKWISNVFIAFIITFSFNSLRSRCSSDASQMFSFSEKSFHAAVSFNVLHPPLLYANWKLDVFVVLF